MCRNAVFRITVVLVALQVLACSKAQKQAETLSTTQPSASVSDSSQTAMAASSPANQAIACAEQFYKNSRYDSAKFYFEKAAAFHEAAQNWAGCVRAMAELARTMRTLRAIDRAQTTLDRAQEIGIKYLGESHPAMAVVYEVLGRLCFGNNNYDQAIAYFQKELSIRQAVVGGLEQDKIADAFTRIGVMYASKGYHEQALQSLQNALTIRKTIDRELQTWEAGNLYFYFGNLHIHRGEYDLALEYYSKTMAIWQAIKGDSLHSFEVANLYHNLGLIHAQKGNYSQALDYYQKSLAMCQKLFGERHPAVAMRYQGMGNVYFELGRYSEARALHQKSLNLKLALAGKRGVGVARSYGNLGAIFLRTGEYGQALAYYQKALAIFRTQLGSRHRDIVISYNVIGEIYFLKGEFELSLPSYQRALQANVPGFVPPDGDVYRNPPLGNILSEELLLETLYHKNKTLLARAAGTFKPLPDLQAALATSQLALQLIDQTRRGYKAEAAKFFLAEKSTEIYEQAIQIAHALYRATGDSRFKEQAWQFVERSRAGILLDALAEADAKKFAGIPDSLLEKERRLRADLAFHEKRVLEEEEKGDAADSLKVLTWQAELFDLKRAYENLLARYETNYPDYFNLKYQSKIAEVTEIREWLLDERTALIEYFVGQDSLYIFTLTNDGLDLKSAPRDSLLEGRVTELRLGIVNQQFEQYVSAGHALYQTVLAPVAVAHDRENLIIIPDGPLCFVPFEALIRDMAGVHTEIKEYRGLPFLLKKHAICYGYSTTLLLEMMKRQRGPINRDYLAFAPLFAHARGAIDDKVASDSRSTQFVAVQRATDTTRAIAAGYLAATKDEVQGVGNLFKKRVGFLERWFGNDVQVVLEEQASETSVKSNRLADFRYVHFATHGFVNESKPKLSGLLLAPERAASQAPEEDGVLYLGEIYNLQLNADLVVLSACETGLGKVAKGEGLIGLARGFLYAGAANLLVSLWQVNDASTANLMIDFYQNVLAGKSKAESLRAAKLDMIERHVKYAKPYHWAPFVLIGE